MRVRNIIYYIVFLAVWSFACFSCGKITYEGFENDDVKVYIDCGPDDTVRTYKVMMSRLINSLHYVCPVDTVPVIVRIGEYYASVFQVDTLVYNLTGLSSFAADCSVSMQEVYATVSPEVENRYGILEDFNPYSPFVCEADSLLSADFKKFSAVDTSMTVTFSPRPLTQKLKFVLRIKVQDGVEIYGLRAAISGVPSRVRLMSGLLRNDAANPTYRQYVDMELKESSGDVSRFEGEVWVLGLFPPQSTLYDAGPGIFQVEVSASVDDNGVLRRKIFHAGINMRDVIVSAGLMEEAKDRSGMRIIRHEASLEVPAMLHIGKENILPSEDEGMVQWFEKDVDINVEI